MTPALLPYRAILGARFRMMLQYRAAAIAGLFTQIVFGLILIMIYEAFYRSSTAAVQPPGRGWPQAMTFAQIASYVWLGQGLLSMLPWNADPDMRSLIRSGGVAYELARPVDLYSMWFARAFARRTAPTLLRALPMAIFAMLLLPLLGLPEWRLAAPALEAGLVFVVSLVGALALACAFSTLLDITLLWTLSGEGIVMIAATLVSLFSGLTIPLPLFPEWAQGVLPWLPFAGMADQPFRLYTGQLPLADAPLVIARQLAWAIVLVGIGRYFLARGLRRIVVQGG